ncbi:DUF4340 domain-containing protein [Halieaceae bacterium IMCC14734]|uniref:DUF4340 domain-containing protein n=1 Tax=Candidatus Litorirhabdus singularis TaxID=2518993 RepID=A0ABT3TDC2_9GAMM|nr:DUF4340 domain-containing protein [Candidatus Litorirhabdus singularis]MCX2980305.1 DUF4340 domain-containing protein [Candidatus Litorirhabdus singularis]
MNRSIKLLAALLVVQLLIASWIFWPQQQTLQNDAQTAVVTVEPESIQRLIISDLANSTVIQRRDGDWVLPEYHYLPAAEDKLSALLQQLPSLQQGWPVAQTEAAALRFEVATTNYQRKLEWVSGDEVVATLYLGTSPGFRKVHARRADSNDIYAITFNAFDAPAQQGQWFDQTLLQLNDIERVEGLDYALERSATGWQSNTGREANVDAVDELINGLENLIASGVVSQETATILHETTAPPTLVAQTGGERYEIRLFQIDETYYIKRSDIDIYFNLSALDFDRLNTANADNLFAKTVPDDQSL